MTASIQGMSEVAGRSSASMDDLSRSIIRGEEAAQLSAETMARLSGNAGSLQSIVDVITEIAAHTNLLAMNAVIDSVSSLTREVRDEMEQMAVGFNTILKRAAAVRQLGSRSGAGMQALDEAISDLKR